MFSRGGSVVVALLLAAVSDVSGEVTSDIFTVNCSPLTVQRSDPIVSPGRVSSHVHVITGGTAFKRTMGAKTAKRAEATTCDKILDHSNYWVPQLYHINRDGRFELVQMTGNAVYYMNRACDYAAGRTSCPDRTRNFAAAPPKGLRMVSGNPSLRTYDDSDFGQRAISHMCFDRDDGLSKEYKSLPPRLCNTIRSQVTFPPCWDGQNVAPADLTSHMAFPAIGDYNGGVCPQSHPVAIAQLFFEFFFDTSLYGDRDFVFANGDRTGYGFHGDFINGWTDQARLGDALRTCTGPGGVDAPDCSLNVGEDGSAGHASQQTPETPPPKEQVGMAGPLKKLPGDNPPTGKAPGFSGRIRGRNVLERVRARP